MTHKTCSRCKQIQPNSEFYLYHGKPRSQCKSCTRDYLTKTKESRSLYHKEYYAKTREHKLEKTHINYEKNKDLRKQQASLWNKKNKDRVNYLQRERYRLRPETKSEHKHRRRARLNNNGVYHVSTKFLNKLRSSSCAVCKSTNSVSIDHIVPISRGGAHSEGNLQPLCFSCNSSKGNKTMMEWKLFMKFSRV